MNRHTLISILPALLLSILFPETASAEKATASAEKATASAEKATASADNWPQFRGPEGTGISEASTIPTDFTPSDYNWSIDLGGTGHSSPVIWDERIFLTVVPAGKEDIRELRCLSTADGSTLWAREEKFEVYHNHKFNTSASTTPVIDATGIFVYAATEGRILLQAFKHSGEEIWSRDWSGFAMEHGQAASPLLIDDVVIIANDQLEGGGGFIMGLDRATGKTLWEHSRVSGKAGYSTPAIAPHPRTESGRQVVFSSMTYGFTGIDPGTGKLLWKHEPGFTFRSVGTPVYGGGILFATVGAGGGGKDSVALDLEANPEKPVELYRLTKDIPYVPTPIIHEGRIYLWQDAGILRCIDARSGDTVYENRVGGNYFSSPILVGGNLWGMSREGRVVIVKAGDTFEIVAEHDLGTGVNATPAVANGVLYIRTDTHLISIGGG